MIDYQNFTLSDDYSPSSASSADLSGVVTEPKIADRTHSLALSSDESLDMVDDEILDNGQSPKHNQWQNQSVLEWTTQQVTNWLTSLKLEQYVSEFTAKSISGEQLLHLDGTKLKALGVNSQDRTTIKKKIKDMKLAMERARKAHEKIEKQKERLRRREQEQQFRKGSEEITSTDEVESSKEQ